MKNANTPNKSLMSKQHEDKVIQLQFNKVFNEFFKQPFTMKMVSVQTQIDRANICWYCRNLRKNKRIAAVKKGICPVTKHRAIYWTTNPNLFPINPQLNLF